MTVRIAPEPIGNVSTGLPDNRPRPAPVGRRPSAAPEASDSYAAHAAAAAPSAAPEPPPLPERDPPGTAYVLAVLSGALSPRPTSLQELFVRTGSGWVPPDSEYRLTDKLI